MRWENKPVLKGIDLNAHCTITRKPPSKKPNKWNNT